MITYQVDMQDLMEIEADLGMLKDKSKYVLRGAVNETAKDVKQLLADEAAKEYVMTRSAFNRHIKIDKAKVSTLTATVHSSGKVSELYEFKVSPRRYSSHNRPELYKGKVKLNNQLSKLVLKPNDSGDKYKAFVVRYKSGHVTVAQRVPGKHMKNNPKKESVKTLFSPSIPNMLGYERGVYGIVEPQIHDLLVKHIQNQMLKFLK